MNDSLEIPVDRIPLNPPKPTMPTPPKPSKAAEPESAKAETAAKESPTPPPPQRWVGEAIRDLFTWTPKKTVIASAVGSLALGAVMINAIMTRTPPPPQEAKLQTVPTSTTDPANTAEPPQPTITPDPVVSPPPLEPITPVPFVSRIEPVQTPAPPTAVRAPSIEPSHAPGTPGFNFSTTQPLPPPATITPVEFPPLQVQPTSVTPAPAAPLPTPTGLIIPAMATEPAQGPPSTPAGSGGEVLPLPVIPTGSGGTPGPTPAAPSSGPVVPAPLPAPTTPTLPGPTLPLPSGTPAQPELPKPKAEPELPKAKNDPVIPAPTPGLPPPLGTPPTPVPAPRAEPTPVPAPRIETVPLSVPDQTGPKPITFVETPSAAPASLTLSKQPGESELHRGPAPDAGQPRTGFDVDLHEVKTGETFQTISKLHYGDAKYAEALRAFNKSGDLSRMRDVEVPPMYVLRQKYSQHLGAARPTPEPTRDAGRGGIEWASSGEQPREKTYKVTREGMTLRDVAADELGTAKDWEKIWNLNLQLRPDDKLPVGTVVKIPK